MAAAAAAVALEKEETSLHRAAADDRVADCLAASGRLWRAYVFVTNELIREDFLMKLYARNLTEDLTLWDIRTGRHVTCTLYKTWTAFTVSARRILWLEAALHLLSQSHDEQLTAGYDLLLLDCRPDTPGTDHEQEQQKPTFARKVLDLWNDRVADMVFDVTPTPGKPQRERLRERGYFYVNKAKQCKEQAELCLSITTWLLTIAQQQETIASQELRQPGSRHLAQKREQLAIMQAHKEMLEKVLSEVVKFYAAHESRNGSIIFAAAT